jgi:tRNA wybutosine-synthesizing protein 4
MVQRKLLAAGVQFSRPTLFLSECVLVYIEPEESGAVIRWAAQSFPAAAFLTYEQILPHDAFGQMMVRHLEVRWVANFWLRWVP